jgi:hypothetical protein
MKWLTVLKILKERFLLRISKQVAVKYLESLQVDLSQKADARKGSKKVHIKTPHFEFDFLAKRTLDEMKKKTFIVPYLHNRGKYSDDSIYYPSWKYICT